MKRLIPASILFVIVITTYISSLIYITKICNSTIDRLQNIVEIYEQNDSAKEESKNLKKYWEDKEKILSLFINHNHIDEIEQAISSLTVYAKEKDNVIFYEYADKTKVLLHQIIEDTKISTHSIF